MATGLARMSLGREREAVDYLERWQTEEYQAKECPSMLLMEKDLPADNE